MKKRKLNINAGEPLVDESPKQGWQKGEEAKDTEDNGQTHFPSSNETSTDLEENKYGSFYKTRMKAGNSNPLEYESCCGIRSSHLWLRKVCQQIPL